MSKAYANLPDKTSLGLFGRSKGKTLSPAQKLRIENLLPTLAITTGAVDPSAIWPEVE